MTIAEIKKQRDNYNRINNDGGEGYNPYDKMLDEAIEAEAKKPIWTKEQTMANRVAWNTEIKKIIAAHNGGYVPAKEVAELEAKIGFNLSTLKGCVAKWGL